MKEEGGGGSCLFTVYIQGEAVSCYGVSDAVQAAKSYMGYIASYIHSEF